VQHNSSLHYQHYRVVRHHTTVDTKVQLLLIWLHDGTQQGFNCLCKQTFRVQVFKEMFFLSTDKLDSISAKEMPVFFKHSVK
jgi:hypothetical protein